MLRRRSKPPRAQRNEAMIDPLVLACFLSDSRTYLGLNQFIIADKSERERRNEPRSSTY